jgi:HSP20 family protein
MAIVRWNPWSIDRFFEDDFDMPTIPGLSRLAGQGLNLYETEDAVVAEAALPGIPDKNIDVTVEDGIVRIVGSMEEKSGDGRRSYMSTLSSSYNYSFRLPQGTVQDAEPTCELEDGVLMLSFPKVQKAAPKKLKVNRKSASGKDNGKKIEAKKGNNG